MSAEFYTALFAGITLLILWTTTVLGGGFWLSNKFGTLKDDILEVFKKHEDEDDRRFEHINELLMRDNINKDPEFPRRKRGG